MSFRTTLVWRTSENGHVTVSDDVLKEVAAELMSEGFVTITDPDDNRHDCQIENLVVTEKGLEADLTTLYAKRSQENECQ